MAKLSSRPELDSLDGTEEVHVVHEGVSKRAPVDLISDAVSPVLTPVSRYADSPTGVDYARKLVRGTMEADHSGEFHALLHSEMHAVGSGASSEGNSDAAISASVYKAGYAEGTSERGEVNAYVATIRNDGPDGGATTDASLYLGNGQNAGDSGYISGLEVLISNIERGPTYALRQQVAGGVASIDRRSVPAGFSYGLYARAIEGQISHGLLLASSGSSGFGEVITYSHDGAGIFVVYDDGTLETSGDIAWAGAEATAYTPTISPASGSFTSASASGRYKYFGKMVWVSITATITTNGTAAGTIAATLPVAGKTGVLQFLHGGETSVVGTAVQGRINGADGYVRLVKYDNTYPGGSGYSITVTGTYEAA